MKIVKVLKLIHSSFIYKITVTLLSFPRKLESRVIIFFPFWIPNQVGNDKTQKIFLNQTAVVAQFIEFEIPDSHSAVSITLSTVTTEFLTLFFCQFLPTFSPCLARRTQ